MLEMFCLLVWFILGCSVMVLESEEMGTRLFNMYVLLWFALMVYLIIDVVEVFL